MGLFDFLFGKNKAQEETDLDPSSSSEPAGPRMPGVDEWEDMDGEERVAWLGQQLEELKAACEKAGVRTNPAHLEAELRGTYKGRPIAVKIDDDGDAELRVKFINRRGFLSVGPPVAGFSDRKDDDAFWDDGDEYSAPLVAPGVAILTFKRDEARSKAVWNGLSQEMRDRIAGCVRGGLGPISLRHQEIEADSTVGPEHQIPVTPTILRALDDMVAIAETFAEGEAPIAPMLPAGAAAASLPPPEKKTCDYCSTTFYVDMSDTRCPACGAN